MDLVSTGSAEHIGFYLKFYADDKERRAWLASFPNDVLPLPAERQPADHVRVCARLMTRHQPLTNVATRSYIQAMKTMGIRELKNRLSEVVRAVKSGEHILVTDRGTVVAELVPPGRPGTDPSVPPGLARLVERGVARLGAPNDPSLYRGLPRLRQRPASAARLLDEERGAR